MCTTVQYGEQLVEHPSNGVDLPVHVAPDEQPQDDIAVALALAAQGGELVGPARLQPNQALAPAVASTSYATLPSGIVAHIASKAAWVMAMRIIAAPCA
jgi:hypothetical protein